MTAANHPTEFEAFAPRRRSHTTSSITHWISTLFSKPRTPTTKSHHLNEKLLSSRSSSSSRDSLDLESQPSPQHASSSSSSSSRKIDPRTVSDLIIGLSDGLTVPFALTAGLSALGNTRVVIFAGLAELTAGAISMGLGGYLAAKSEEDAAKATLHSTRELVRHNGSEAAESIREVLKPYEFPERLMEEVAVHLSNEPEKVVKFLMHFQHNLPSTESSRALTCAVTIAGGYFLGGFLPLIPYFLVASDQVLLALWWSFIVMGISLFSFGYAKSCFNEGWGEVWGGVKGGMQMILVGGTAAVCAMSLVRGFDSLAGEA